MTGASKSNQGILVVKYCLVRVCGVRQQESIRLAFRKLEEKSFIISEPSEGR
jgi:hypothetical protein